MKKKQTNGFVFILILLLSFSAIIKAQEQQSSSDAQSKLPESLNKLVSIDLKDVPLERALKELTAKSNIELNFIINNVFQERTISVDLENVSVVEALMYILNKTGTGLTVTEDGLLAIIPITDTYGDVKGVVVDNETGEPLVGVNVLVKGTMIGASTDESGRFSIPQLSPGIYTFEASMIGYEKEIKENMTIAENESIELRFELTERILSLGEIVVTPGHFSLMDEVPTLTNSLASEDVRDFPQLGEDIFRVVNRLPGLSSNDFSAKFAVRGGEYGEVLLMLDGMELFDPYHLKMIQGGFSIIDVDLIENIDMMTGAFSADYGKRLSGVFNMKTRSPAVGKPRTSVALSFMNTRFLTEGTFDEGSGSWQIMARRGYIDYVLKLMGDDDDIDPVYYDIYGKFQYFLNPDHLISGHILASDDDFHYQDDDGEEFVDSRYKNLYAWAKWEAQFSEKLSARTVLSMGNGDTKKFVQEYNNASLGFEASDDRYFDFIGVRQDWSYEYNDKAMLMAGFDYRKMDADYDYYKRVRDWSNPGYNFDLTSADLGPKGDDVGYYAKTRLRFFKPLITEVGLRYDRASWAGDKNYSPRVNISYLLNKRTTLRAGWGQFYQSHDIHELSVTDAEVDFYSANKAEHYVFGVDHTLLNGINLRMEAYYKDLPVIRPRYYNYADQFDITPETGYDRIAVDPEKGESKGVEFYMYRDNWGKHSFWFNYAYSIVEEKIIGVMTPRNMDQRHTINIDYKYEPNSKWSLNLYWTMHSGWPYTDQTINLIGYHPEGWPYWEWEKGQINGARFPEYHRMDVRVNRRFRTSNGLVSVFFEARNFYNRKNVRGYGHNVMYSNISNILWSEKDPDEWLTLIPSFGISWDF
ncbi:TonB-dependent receptor domain-containing protein [candidate division KSB1 bacterium]